MDWNIARKKNLAVSLLLACLLVFTAACGSNNGNTNSNSKQQNESAPEEAASQDGESEKMKVVTSFYPLYYLASEIGGVHVDTVNLIPAGVEPHDWTPRSGDLSTASKAKLLLYHGVGLESWMDSFLKGLSSDSSLMAREMSEGITLIAGDEDGAAAEEEHDDHDHADEHDHGHAEEGHEHSHDTDPHTWVSPKSLLIMADNVKKALIEADPAHAAQFEQNYEVLNGELAALDERYMTELSAASNKNIVVSHQAFGYLARDYGLKQVSIMGLSADAEPRAQDLLKIAKFVKENGVKYIFFEELISDDLAKTLANEADVDTLVLNPLEGLTPAQQKSGDDLMSLLELNLQNLIQALQ